MDTTRPDRPIQPQRPHHKHRQQDIKGIYIVANLHCNLEMGGGLLPLTYVPVILLNNEEKSFFKHYSPTQKNLR